jgi:hypothetical protein
MIHMHQQALTAQRTRQTGLSIPAKRVLPVMRQIARQDPEARLRQVTWRCLMCAGARELMEIRPVS